MASVQLWTKSKFPLGLYIHLNFAEACTVVHVGLPAIAAVISTGALVKPWLALVSTAILIQREWIRGKTENSNGQGVRLRYNFAVGAIDGIKRKGKGPSPCVSPPATVSNSSVDASGLTLVSLDRIIEDIQILQWAGRNPITDPDPTGTQRRDFRRAAPQAARLRQDLLNAELVGPIVRIPPVPGPIGPIEPILRRPGDE